MIVDIVHGSAGNDQLAYIVFAFLPHQTLFVSLLSLLSLSSSFLRPLQPLGLFFPVTALLESLSLCHTADVRHSPSPFPPQRLFSLSCCLSYFRPSLSHSFTPFSPGKEGQLWPCVSWGVPSDSDQWGVSLSSFSRVTIGPWNASVSVSNPHSPHNAPVSITDRTIWLFDLLGVNKNARP